MSKPSDQELAEQYRRIDEEQRARLVEFEKQRKADRLAYLQSRPMESRTVVRSRTVRFQYVAMQIEDGLNGRPFHWNGAQRHFIQVAESMDLTLISRSRAEKAGYTLKRGQKPVGSVYFNAPISKQIPVYVLECQFRRVEHGRAD